MISPADIDEGKTRLLLSHLNRAVKRVKQKEEAKEKLAEHVNKLKKVSRAKSYRKEIRELEKRLSDVMEKEEEIIRHHKTKESFNRRLKEKINLLEKKLSKYIKSKGERDIRIRELEEKIKKRFVVEKREIEILEEQIMNIEKVYRKIAGEKTHTKSDLDRVRKKIESMRKRLQKVGK